MSIKKALIIAFIITLLASNIALAYVPPPTPATCSPGFWKHSQHFQYWGINPDTGLLYKPGDNYPGTTMTLLDALQGGYATRESRFVVAGWLNAANPNAPCIDE